MTKADESKTQQETYMETIIKRLQILDELKKDRDEQKPPQLNVDFLESDSRLSVTKENEKLLSGSLVNSDSTTTAVICEPVKEDLMMHGEKGPRHVLIYAKLSANTLVHPFYGIVQRHHQRWIVMKDLRQCPSLRNAIRGKEMPQSALERLNVACDVAKTMEYLHSVEVLVKRLSDTTILLSSENGTVIPYLTNLDRARLASLPFLFLTLRFDREF